MASGLCDIGGVLPATVRAHVISDGRGETMELRDVDYRRLARQQQGRTSSPLEALSGGGRSGGHFDDDFWGARSPNRGLRAGDGGERDGPRRR